MSDTGRRPQRQPEPGARVVLVVPRSGEIAALLLSRALDDIERLGLDLVAVVDPADHIEALRLIVDGAADIALACRPEHLPSLQLTSFLMAPGKTRPVDRGDVDRRTRLIDRTDRPEVTYQRTLPAARQRRPRAIG
ncbi:hypothetical protein ACQPZX_29345 [Actinoplanes sp. CA-142083]|uniref:hypothetical protein n=1 Tax=Actinoplanes sp. CA-142083 TaxID=3239903 RepID=UPI003D8ABA61